MNPQAQPPLDWNAQTNQYDLRLRWPDGRHETRMITAQPRLGPEAEIEFRAHWSGLAEDAPVEAYPKVLPITDVVLQVTYLPTVHGNSYTYYHNSYTIPDRGDNFRYFDCELTNRLVPGEVRGYSFEVPGHVHPLDVPNELRKHHDLLKGPWRLVKDSLREIVRERHHQLTWQRRQQPDYYLHQVRQAEEDLHLTAAQARQVVRLAAAGYVLRAKEGRWEIGAIDPENHYQSCIRSCSTPTAALAEAVKLRLMTAQ